MPPPKRLRLDRCWNKSRHSDQGPKSGLHENVHSEILCKQKAKVKRTVPVWYDSFVEFPIAPGPVVPGGFDVVGFGLNTIDLIAVVRSYPEPDSKQPLADFVECPGGQAATAMTACARLGWRARYVGRFGDDARGRLARASLQDEGVDLSACEDVSAPQPFSLILGGR